MTIFVFKFVFDNFTNLGSPKLPEVLINIFKSLNISYFRIDFDSVNQTLRKKKFY